MNLYGIKIKSFCGVDLKAKEPVIIDNAVVGVVSRNKTEVNTVSNLNKAIHYYSDNERNKTIRDSKYNKINLVENRLHVDRDISTINIEYDINSLVVIPDFSGMVTRNKSTSNSKYNKINLVDNKIHVDRDKAIINEQYRDIKNDISIVNILRDNAIVNSSIEIVEVH